MSSHHRILVSVIIPYYNQPGFLREAVQSARSQTHPNIEVIVVDDGSLVSAASVLQDMSDVQVLQTDNQGVSAARNLGLKRSSGEFILFLDQDDCLPAQAIESHLHALETQPDAGLSFGPTRHIDREGKELKPARTCRPRKDYFRALLESNPIAASPGSVMVRSSILTAVGCFNKSFSSRGEDYDLYLRIARVTKFVRPPTCVLEYRRHGSNASLDHDQMFAGTMAVLDNLALTATEEEKKQIRFGRRKWRHTFFPRPTLTYKIVSLYYRLRTLSNVSFRS
jgi:glycosyltransferase involved in cell wall biosynthesis